MKAINGDHVPSHSCAAGPADPACCATCGILLVRCSRAPANERAGILATKCGHNACRERSRARTPLNRDIIARPMPGGWALLNHPEKGWSSYAEFFSTLAGIERTYRCSIGDAGADELGAFVQVLRA